MSFTFTIDWAKAKQYLNYTARIGLIVLFAYAGTSKLIARQGFAHDMMRSLLLPVQAVVVLQWVLPVVELVVVVALTSRAYETYRVLRLGISNVALYRIVGSVDSGVYLPTLCVWRYFGRYELPRPYRV